VALKLLFLGTGTFALPAFRELLQSKHSMLGLVTQPDRTGPGRHHHDHPMKEAALAAGFPVFQPDNVNSADSLERLRQFQADLFVVAAYGQILKAELLAIPPRGAFNIHASLLPRHRGAAPINYAILAGDVETGVSVFRIEPKLDAGPVLGMARMPIGVKETAGELEDRLSVLAAPLIVDVVNRIEAGTAEPIPQDASLVTRSPKMPKSMGAIDWSASSAAIERHIRAMQPWPVAYSFLSVPRRVPVRIALLDADPVRTTFDVPSGTVIASGAGELVVQTGEGGLAIRRLQPAGKRAQTIEEFQRGARVPAGSVFGAEPESQ
jgi:methionyl-tRNA formyltransferase